MFWPLFVQPFCRTDVTSTLHLAAHIISRLTYACSAWWGFCNSGERDHLAAVITRLAKKNYLPPDQPTLHEMVATVDVQPSCRKPHSRTCSTHPTLEIIGIIGIVGIRYKYIFDRKYRNSWFLFGRIISIRGYERFRAYMLHEQVKLVNRSVDRKCRLVYWHCSLCLRATPVEYLSVIANRKKMAELCKGLLSVRGFL